MGLACELASLVRPRIAGMLAHGATQYVMAQPAWTYEFLWLDCNTGRRVERSGVKVSAGDRTWPRPAGIGKELAAWVRRGPSTAAGAPR